MSMFESGLLALQEAEAMFAGTRDRDPDEEVSGATQEDMSPDDGSSEAAGDDAAAQLAALIRDITQSMGAENGL